MEFTCECCHYATTVKCNYAKHLSSAKHIIQNYKHSTAFKSDVSKAQPKLAEVSPELAEVSPKGIVCKYCNKSFKFKQSMYRHLKKACKKSCTDKSCSDKSCSDDIYKELNELLQTNLALDSERKEYNNSLKENNDELKKQLIQQHKIFEIQSKQIEFLTCMLEIRTHL
jgi:hypothetical protein